MAGYSAPSREAKAGIEVDCEGVLLTDFLSSDWSVCFLTHDHIPRDSTHYSGPSLPTPITQSRKCPAHKEQADLMEGNSKLRVPLPSESVWIMLLLPVIWWFPNTRYDYIHVNASMAKVTIICTRLFQFPIYLLHSVLPIFRHSSSIESLGTTGKVTASRQCLLFIWDCWFVGWLVGLLVFACNKECGWHTSEKKETKLFWNFSVSVLIINFMWNVTELLKTQCKSGLFRKDSSII